MKYNYGDFPDKTEEVTKMEGEIKEYILKIIRNHLREMKKKKEEEEQENPEQVEEQEEVLSRFNPFISAIILK